MNAEKPAPGSLAERLSAEVQVMRHGSPEEVARAMVEVEHLIVALQNVETTVDALALQAVATEIARLVWDGQISNADRFALMLMCCAMIRVTHFLESGAGEFASRWSFSEPAAQPVMQ